MRTIIYKSDSGGVTAVGNSSPLPTTYTRSADAFQVTLLSNVAHISPALVKQGQTGKSIYITDLVLGSNVAQRVELIDGDDTSLFNGYVAANTSIPMTFSTPILVTAAKNLLAKAYVSGNLAVTITGYII